MDEKDENEELELMNNDEFDDLYIHDESVELEATEKLKVNKKQLIKKFSNKIKIIFVILIFVILLFAIRIIYNKTIPAFHYIKPETNTATEEQGKAVEKYFPIQPNTLYEYTQTGGSNKNRMMFVDYYDDSKVQYSVYQPSVSDKWFNEVYEFGNGEIKKVLGNAMFEQNVNLLDYDYQQEPTVILKEPVVEGNEWGVNEDGATASITDMDVKVSTPDGLYKTIEISIDNKNGSYEKIYLSEAVGLVKYVSTDIDGVETELLLSGTEPVSEGLERVMYVYYLDPSTYVGQPTIVTYNENTNEENTDILQEILSTSPDDNLKPLISPSTQINYIDINPNDSYVHVDFSNDFLNYTSSNASTEAKHLSAIANTFCRYYQVLNCMITIDGQPYSTDTLQLGPNDSIKAQF